MGEDESGFSLVSPLKRTGAPRGQTPTVRTSLWHGERLNLLGTLQMTPRGRRLKRSVQSYRHSLTGEEIIAFLRRLLRGMRGPIVLLWDKPPIHQRQKVQTFIAQHPRLQVHNFPTSAPELNPVEFVWTQVSEYLAGMAPRNHSELRTNVSAAIARTRRSQKRLWACIAGAKLAWK